jgi:hypothetical protein
MKTTQEQLNEMEQMVLMGRLSDAMLMLIRFLMKKFEEQ